MHLFLIGAFLIAVALIVADYLDTWEEDTWN